jgi:hypothetical protein
MRESNKPADDLDDGEILGESDLNLDDFIDAMHEVTERRAEPTKPTRAGWQRVDDWRDARWLRDQLNDWDDWKNEADE